MYNTRARVLDGVKNINPESERESKLVQKPLVIWEREREEPRPPPPSRLSRVHFWNTLGRAGVFVGDSPVCVCAGLAVLSLSWLVVLVEKFPFALKRCDI